MPNTRDIRRRIKSVRNTAQITKAMQMVAASKMRRAQQAALAGRDYSLMLIRTLNYVRHHLGEASHPLFEPGQGDNELVLLVTPDKGLCGALNTNLLREAAKFESGATCYVTAGRRGTQWLGRARRQLLADYPLSDSPTFRESRNISRFCLEEFNAGRCSKVTVLFTYFVNTLTQEPITRTLLPIDPSVFKQAVQGVEDHDGSLQIKFEPDPASVLEALLTYYLHYQVQQVLLNARASEHSARMVAMKNATDNAKTLIKDLTLEYNKVRQAGITNELLEISTAQMALA